MRVPSNRERSHLIPIFVVLRAGRGSGSEGQLQPQERRSRFPRHAEAQGKGLGNDDRLETMGPETRRSLLFKTRDRNLNPALRTSGIGKKRVAAFAENRIPRVISKRYRRGSSVGVNLLEPSHAALFLSTKIAQIKLRDANLNIRVLAHRHDLEFELGIFSSGVLCEATGLA